MYRLSHFVAATVLVGLTASTAIASECEVEDWRSRHTGEYLWIEGTTTCEEGRISLHLVYIARVAELEDAADSSGSPTGKPVGEQGSNSGNP